MEFDGGKYARGCLEIYDFLNTVRPEERCYDDITFAQYFAAINSYVAKYNTTTKSWWMYDGKVWTEDVESMTVLCYAKQLSAALILYGTTLPDSKVKDAFVKYVSGYTNLRKREALIRDARDECYFTKNDLDKDPFVFNCQNGTLNLQTFEFKPHDSEDLLSKISNVHYDPKAKCERWVQFIDEVLEGDADNMRYLQKLLGYTLTGSTVLEQCFILYGPKTRNGKSTALETYAFMLGNTDGYAVTISPETLAVKISNSSRNHSSDVARLRGARFVNAAEFPQRMLLDNALLKNWTGGDRISTREIYEKQTEFEPMLKLFMNTNHLPLITDKTLFTSNRINVIEFNRHFEKHEQDLTLKATLREPKNLSGIFNWCIEGLMIGREEGLDPPACVIAATNDYFESSDKVQQFINECLVQSDSNSKVSMVYQLYERWCEESGLCALNKGHFIDELKTKGIYASSGRVAGENYKNILKGYVPCRV